MFLFIGLQLLALTAHAASQTPVALFTDAANQASDMFKQAKFKTAEPQVFIPKSEWQKFADEFVEQDYSEKKVHAQLLLQSVAFINPHLLCTENTVMLAGENQHIRDYAKKLHLTKLEQLNYGFLGARYSIGVSIYVAHSCAVLP